MAAKRMGLSVAELEIMSCGLLLDMIIAASGEEIRDASQEDINSFFGGG